MFCQCFLLFYWSTYEQQDLRNYWTDLHQIFTDSRPIQVLNKSLQYLAIAQGMLPWQPILQAKLAFLAFQASFLALPFKNRSEYRKDNGHVKMH